MSYEYQKLLRQVLNTGRPKEDRTGTGTLSLFGERLRFNLRDGFPLLTTKSVSLRWIAEELFWMLSGSTNEGDLRAKGVDIWKEWATKEQCAKFGRKEGDLGPTYAKQWRRFGYQEFLKTYGPGNVPSMTITSDGVDQIAGALDLLRNNPSSRRILVSAWNPKEVTSVALPPCHTLFQFETYLNTSGGRVLSCHMYQRSADLFLGVPYNIASYALLTHMIAHVMGFEVGDLIVSFGDVHIYNNHIDQVKLQISRECRPKPTLNINYPLPVDGDDLTNLLRLSYGHLLLDDYDPHPKIAADVSV